jgi:hypothetical protein
VVSFTPRAFYPRGKVPRYPLGRRLDGPQNRSGRRGEKKILDPTGTRTPTSSAVQPIASRYPDKHKRCAKNVLKVAKGAHTRSIKLRKIVLRNTSLPIHDQVNQHHTRSIMLHNTQCCATWLIVYGPLKPQQTVGRNYWNGAAFFICLAVVKDVMFWRSGWTRGITGVFGLCPSSGILKTREHNVSETGSDPSSGGGGNNSVGFLRKSWPHSLDVQWLRSVLSNGPNRFGVPTLSPEDRKRCSLRDVMFFRIQEDGQSPKTQ